MGTIGRERSQLIGVKQSRGFKITIRLWNDQSRRLWKSFPCPIPDLRFARLWLVIFLIKLTKTWEFWISWFSLSNREEILKSISFICCETGWIRILSGLISLWIIWRECSSSNILTISIAISINSPILIDVLWVSPAASVWLLPQYVLRETPPKSSITRTNRLR